MAASRLSGTMRRLFRLPAYFYRWRLGWLLGHRFLLLIHVGRRSGRRRCTVLEIAEYRPEGPEAIVISAFGHDADWLRNLEATPASPEVVIGSRRFPASCRILGEEEAIRVLGGYERRNRLVAPIIRLVLSRLLGWRYDGSTEHRRRLAAQLPFVAFRPRPGPSDPR
ncbi:MAG: nitroreductase family deazaflavin-dependent oxidoreductase [Stellaceae bacterium]|jgi:deazaflavin-dependent oxidoreductase (nitroreductase family)